MKFASVILFRFFRYHYIQILSWDGIFEGDPTTGNKLEARIGRVEGGMKVEWGMEGPYALQQKSRSHRLGIGKDNGSASKGGGRRRMGGMEEAGERVAKGK
jgi:hypothetical protein